MLTLFLSNLIAGEKNSVLNVLVAKISKIIEGMSLVFGVIFLGIAFIFLMNIFIISIKPMWHLSLKDLKQF